MAFRKKVKNLQSSSPPARTPHLPPDTEVWMAGVGRCWYGRGGGLTAESVEDGEEGMVGERWRWRGGGLVRTFGEGGGKVHAKPGAVME